MGYIFLEIYTMYRIRTIFSQSLSGWFFFRVQSHIIIIIIMSSVKVTIFFYNFFFKFLFLQFLSLTCSRGKSWVVELWTHHFYFSTHNLPCEYDVEKVVIQTFPYYYWPNIYLKNVRNEKKKKKKIIIYIQQFDNFHVCLNLIINFWPS